MRRAALLISLTVLWASPVAVAAQAPGDRDKATTLTLSADGVVKARPDLAVIRLVIAGEAATAGEALRRSRTALAAAQKGLAAVGVPQSAVRIEGLSIDPQYVFHQGEKRTLAGYEASTRLSVDVSDLARLGEVLDAAVAGGGATVSGVDFSLSNPRAAQADAQREALTALLAKANLYALTLGLKVSHIASVSDAADASPHPPMVTARFSPPPPAPLPDAGALSVTAVVTGVFALAK